MIYPSKEDGFSKYLREFDEFSIKQAVYLMSVASNRCVSFIELTVNKQPESNQVGHLHLFITFTL